MSWFGDDLLQMISILTEMFIITVATTVSPVGSVSASENTQQQYSCTTEGVCCSEPCLFLHHEQVLFSEQNLFL